MSRINMMLSLERLKMAKAELQPQPRSISAAAEDVFSTEELLTEILLRVPAKPLLRFKCVSKHWLSLISNPKFCHNHTLKNPNSPVSAVLPGNSKRFSYIYCPPGRDPSDRNFHNPPLYFDPLSVLTDQHGDIDIISSCNGLLLCCPFRGWFRPSNISTCFVLNPLTTQFTKIEFPQASEEPSSIIWCTLAMDPSESPHYNIICTTMDRQYYTWLYKILIYSSANRTWRRAVGSVPKEGNIDYIKGVYWNGAVHWVGRWANLSYYHIEQDLVRIVFNRNEELIEYLLEHRCESYFKESADGDHLHLIEKDLTSYTEFRVLEMGKDYGGWIIKYIVDVRPLCDRFSHIGRGSAYVLFVVDGSTLFLHSDALFISCDLKSNTFKCFKLNDGHRGYHLPTSYMYKETLASVW